MATQFSMLQIMNAALTTQGFDEIVAANDGSEEWRVLSRNWPGIVEAELEVSNFHFTRQQAFLNLAIEGKFGHSSAYLVPQTALHVRRVWTETDNGDRNTDIVWGQDGTHVHCDQDEGIYIEYLVAADPSFWGANFSRGIQMKLEAVLLRLKEDFDSARAMDKDADDVLQRARTLSSKARSARDMYVPSRFAQARFQRG